MDILLMRYSYLRLVWSLLFFLFLSQPAGADKCEDDDLEGFVFPRTFFARSFDYGNPSRLMPTKELMQSAIGDCADVNDLALKAMEYFQPYGLNLDDFERRPFQPLDDHRFVISPGVVDPRTYSKIVTETFFNYAKYVSTQLDYMAWLITSKVDINGPGRSLPADHMDVYGMFRLRTHGRHFCVTYTGGSPMLSFSNPVGPTDLRLYNKHFGYGEARGININRNGSFEILYTLSFPGNP